MTESNSTTAPRQRSGWALWLIWIAATCAGTIAAALLWSAVALSNFWPSMFTLVFTGLSLLLTGATQHYALRLFLPAEANWFKRTVIGVLVGILVGLVLAMFGGLIGLMTMKSLHDYEGLDRGILWVEVGYSISLLVLPAIHQRRVLLRHSDRAGWWLLASPLGWCAGMVGAIVVWNAIDFSSGLVDGVILMARALVASLMMGLLAGGITGAALVYILRATPALAQYVEPPGVDGDMASAEVVTPDDPDVWG